MAEHVSTSRVRSHSKPPHRLYIYNAESPALSNLFMPRKPTPSVTHGQESHICQTRFRPVCICLWALATILSSASANASVFGETVSISPIGAGLAVEVASPGMTRDTMTNCVRLPGAQSDDGIATLRGGSLALTGSGANARLVVTHPEPVFEPILRFTLQDICATRLRRTYTLLMPDPAPVARLVAREADRQPTQVSPRRAAVTTTPGTQSWTTVQGESVASIAQALYPRDQGARHAFINGVIRGNPEAFGAGRHPAAVLPAGTELRIPSLAGVAAASSEPRRAPRAAAATETPAAAAPARVEPVTPQLPSPAPIVSERDRLVVDTGARDELAGREIDPDAMDDTGREERLVAAIDRSIDSQLELLERIRRLEELQVALRAQIEAVAPGQPVVTPPPGHETRTPATRPPAAQASAATDERIPERESPAPTVASSSSSWFNWAIAGGVLALLLLLMLRRRPGGAADPGVVRARRAPITEAWPEAAPISAGVDRQRRIDEPSHAGDTIPPVIAWSEPATRTAAQAVSETFSDMLTLPPAVVVEEEPEEHESAVELAEIMLSFGRVHGAAETLEAFIESNPKQAIMPWLKLLEVYHTAGMEPEFGALATELNKTFNARAVTWQNFHEVSTLDVGVEALMHIMNQLQETWGTRQCQRYIDLLVRDNRKGTRLGFELGVVDDLLMLAGVLELQLGRYKPTVGS